MTENNSLETYLSVSPQSPSASPFAIIKQWCFQNPILSPLLSLHPFSEGSYPLPQLQWLPGMLFQPWALASTQIWISNCHCDSLICPKLPQTGTFRYPQTASPLHSGCALKGANTWARSLRLTLSTSPFLFCQIQAPVLDCVHCVFPPLHHTSSSTQTFILLSPGLWQQPPAVPPSLGFALLPLVHSKLPARSYFSW